MEGDENEIQQQIEARIGELPLDIQEAILSSDFGDKILSIGSSRKLHIDQIQSLNDLAMLAMLGFMPLNDLEKEIAQQIGVPEDMAVRIASDINTQIFAPIQESMKKFSATAGPGTAVSATPAQKPSLAEVLPKEGVRSVPLTTIPSTPGMAAPAPVSAPVVAPTTPVAPSPTPPAVPAVPKIDMHPADIALTQKTVAMPAAPAAAPAATPAKPAEAKAVPPKPTDYKADPYREPIN